MLFNIVHGLVSGLDGGTEEQNETDFFSFSPAQTLPQVILVLLASLCFAVQFGLNYGVSNQNTYFLQGMRLFDPGLFAKDWVITQAADPHPFFKYIVYFLFLLTPKGFSFIIANVVANFFGAFIIFRIIAQLSRDNALPIFLAVMAILCGTRTQSVAETYIFSWTFQPSSVGALGFLLSLFFFIRGSYFASGLAIGLGGLFHANYIILSLPLYFAAHIILGKTNLLRRATAQLLIPLITLLPFFPIMWEMATSPHANAAQAMLFNIRLPHNYVPAHFAFDFMPFVGWLLMGFAMGSLFLNRHPGRNVIVALCAPMIAIVGIGTLLTTFIYIPAVAQLMVWRLTPFIDLFMLIIVCICVFSDPLIASYSNKKVLLATTIAFVGAGLISRYYYYYAVLRIPAILFLLLLIWLYRLYIGRRQSLFGLNWRQFIMASAVIILLIGELTSMGDFKARSRLIKGYPPEFAELYQWCQKTPKDALFLIVPNMQDFRLQAKRSVVVDWKSGGLTPTDALEWYHRMVDVCGNAQFADEADAIAGYNAMDSSRFSSIIEKYGADYIIFPNKSIALTHIAQPTAFVNDSFVVLRVDHKH
ncbi:MAG: hypothetical protein PHR28_00535 [candidate division Zixibacteria bacterium]|nr:hypothetical protein [candidate division Zixibacteria bacterium]